MSVSGFLAQAQTVESGQVHDFQQIRSVQVKTLLIIYQKCTKHQRY